MNKKTMVYNFTLILSGLSEPTENIDGALYEAGCSDALLGFRNRTPYLEFDRNASSLESAILSSIRDVESADIGAKVEQVEIEELSAPLDVLTKIPVPVIKNERAFSSKKTSAKKKPHFVS